MFRTFMLDYYDDNDKCYHDEVKSFGAFDNAAAIAAILDEYEGRRGYKAVAIYEIHGVTYEQLEQLSPAETKKHVEFIYMDTKRFKHYAQL